MKSKILSSIVLCVILIFTTGCGLLEGPDMSEYVQYELNSFYLNENPQEYLELLGNKYTVEDLDTIYDETIYREIDSYLIYCGIDKDNITEGTRTRAYDIFKTLYSYSNFQIGENSKDGSVYMVDILVYPTLNLAQAVDRTVYDSISAEISANVEISKEDVDDVFTNALLDVIEENLLEPIYGAPIALKLSIIQYSEYAEISEDSFYAVYESILKYEE